MVSSVSVSSLLVVIVVAVCSCPAEAGYGGGESIGLEQHGHHYPEAIPGEYEYKVDVKHPKIVSSHGDHKHHHIFVEDQGIQVQKHKVGIYPYHEESYGYKGHY